MPNFSFVKRISESEKVTRYVQLILEMLHLMQPTPIVNVPAAT